MSKIRMNVSVRNKHVANDIRDAISDGIEDSVDDMSPGSIPDQIENVAQHRIRSSGAVFKGELLESFVAEWRRSGNSIIVTVRNVSDHAAPIEYGAEYDDEGPPIMALIPWVIAKMQGFNIPDDDISDLPEPDDIRDDIETPDQPALPLDQIDDRLLEKTFWLQQHIKEEGIDALRYMKAAEVWADASADKSVASFISARLNTL